MIKLVSVNIERSKHLECVLPFLEKENADVVCVQELMEYDIPALENATASPCFFTPTSHHPAEGKQGLEGLGIFSSAPLKHSEVFFYVGNGLPEREFDDTDIHTKHDTQGHAVVHIDINKNGTTFRIANTHFTWTPNGDADDYQREDVKKFLAALEPLGEFVLCGDFNAPRIIEGNPGEIFSAIAAKYTDNIPAHYTTSIDKDLHRAGDLQLMVDGLFSTPTYRVSNVELRGGISDHMAIIAQVEA